MSVAPSPTQEHPTQWVNSTQQAPPKTRELFWAYLYDTGIRLMLWRPDYYSDEPPEDAGAYVEAADEDEEWQPAFWLPYDAIPPLPEGRETARHDKSEGQ